MYYGITLDLAFETEDPRDDIVKEVLRRFPDAIVINKGQVNEERGYMNLVACRHGAHNEPCTEIERWEVGRGKVK